MKFPPTFFESEAFTTNELFDFVHKLINVKIDLHHSHITGEIKGYSHDFCNWMLEKTEMLYHASHIIFLSLTCFF